ncbi:uncharacterized protein LOC117340221 [Pecten maximus]|uniref:uncharacterized protein LOC117340221 n=1 Tax=Pecten maximus TaxID=6579 RepID=UPI001458449A|nr:uncharacterized protein LOC117340221 [Pecten maximus]
MADSRPKVLKTVNVDYDGKQYQVQVEEELIIRLNSTDQVVRGAATEQLITLVRESDIACESSATSTVSTQVATPSTPVATPSTSPVTTPSQSNEITLSPKIWSETEARLLLDTRIEMDSLFQGSTNHKTLWGRIAERMLLSNVRVNGDQCNNKFKAMKRDYRATKDHNEQSGNDKKRCRFYDEFDTVYGCKAGTRPTKTLASFGSEDEQSPVTIKSKKRKVRTTRQSAQSPNSEYLERWEKRQDDRIQTMKAMHDEKVKLLERFLGVLENKHNQPN